MANDLYMLKDKYPNMKFIGFFRFLLRLAFVLLLISFSSCAGFTKGEVYRDPNMDFGAVQTVAVLPLANLSRDQMASERVRDVFMTALLATGSLYVVPPGEVAKGIIQAEIQNAVSPSREELVKLAAVLKADAIITGVVREYGEVRSGTTSSNIISLSFSMHEAVSGKTVWTASTTQGGIGLADRLLGGGGEPMNNITEKAINDILDKLFK